MIHVLLPSIMCMFSVKAAVYIYGLNLNEIAIQVTSSV